MIAFSTRSLKVIFAYVAQFRKNRVGPFQLVSLIRAGHACEIWKVRREGDKGDSGPLAMKLLPQGPSYSKEQVGFLRNEYQVGRSLDHDRVVRFFDFGTVAEGSYLTMELFPVLSIKQCLQLQPEHVARHIDTIIRDAAAGLAHLHERDWIHCDVKPDNFLVGEEGDVKLIDFSLARRRKGVLARLFTPRGPIQGTKSYMSPEQIRARNLDQRSDIYSFGCMLYEIVVGKLPFTGTSTNELLTKHLRFRAPALEAVNRNVEPPFARLVERMMAKDPGRRPSSMPEFLEELADTHVFRRQAERPTERPDEANPS
ncbi:MAG: serine/threonine-protein kinase [Planctomycetia bacterium]|nr:MAG: serine/threonine-protein kinase [Planctomycetia bacterium]